MEQSTTYSVPYVSRCEHCGIMFHHYELSYYKKFFILCNQHRKEYEKEKKDYHRFSVSDWENLNETNKRRSYNSVILSLDNIMISILEETTKRKEFDTNGG